MHMKWSCSLLWVIMMIVFLSACNVVSDPGNTISDTSLDSPTATEANTLREYNHPLPENSPADIIQTQEYALFVSNDKLQSSTAGCVSLSFTEVLQGDTIAVQIDVTPLALAGSTYSAQLRHTDGTVIPVQTHMAFMYVDIPDEAPTGAYDLVVRADGLANEIIAEDVITVSRRLNTEYSFVYSMDNNRYSASDMEDVVIKVAIVNEGDPFILFDNDYVYNASNVVLTKHENPDMVVYEAFPLVHAGEMWEEQYIESGEASVQSYRISLYGAEPGIYDLLVSYNGHECRFDSALEIVP